MATQQRITVSASLAFTMRAPYRPAFAPPPGARARIGKCACESTMALMTALGMPHAAKMHNPALRLIQWSPQDLIAHKGEEERSLFPILRFIAKRDGDDALARSVANLQSDHDRWDPILRAGNLPPKRELDVHGAQEDQLVERYRTKILAIAGSKEMRIRAGVGGRVRMHVRGDGDATTPPTAPVYSADDINKYLKDAQGYANAAREAGRTAAAYADAAKKVLSGPATTDANAMRTKWADVAKANDAEYDDRAAKAREQFAKEMSSGTGALAACPPCWVAIPAALAVGAVAMAAFEGINALYKMGAHDYNSKEAQDKVQSLVSSLNALGVPIPAFSSTWWFGAEDYGNALARVKDRWTSSAGLLFHGDSNYALRDAARFGLQFPTGEATAYAQAMVTKGFGGPLSSIEDLRAESEKYPWVFALWLGRVFGSAYGVSPDDVAASAILAAADWQKRNQAQYDAAPADSDGHATVEYWPADQRDQTMAVAAQMFAIKNKTKEPPPIGAPPQLGDVGGSWWPLVLGGGATAALGGLAIVSWPVAAAVGVGTWIVTRFVG